MTPSVVPTIATWQAELIDHQPRFGVGADVDRLLDRPREPFPAGAIS